MSVYFHFTSAPIERGAGLFPAFWRRQKLQRPGGAAAFGGPGAFGPRASQTKVGAGPERAPPPLCARFARPPPPRAAGAFLPPFVPLTASAPPIAGAASGVGPGGIQVIFLRLAWAGEWKEAVFAVAHSGHWELLGSRAPMRAPKSAGRIPCRRSGCRKSGLRHFFEVFIAPLRLRRGQGAMQGNPCYARLFADLPYMPPNPMKA